MRSVIKIISFVTAVAVTAICAVSCQNVSGDIFDESIKSEAASHPVSYSLVSEPSAEPTSEKPSAEPSGSEETPSEELSEEVSENESFEQSEAFSAEPESSEEPSSSEETPSEEISEPMSEPQASEEVSEEPVSQQPPADKIDPSKIEITADALDSYFNDGVFVGNSIMLGYSKYTTKLRAGNVPSFLGTLKFFCGGSFGIYNNSYKITDETFHPTYQGTKYKVEDAVGAMGAKKVYLNLMGLNDLAMYGNAKECSQLCTNDVIELIEEIESRYPDVEVAVLSATYLTYSRNNMPSLNNKNLSKMNQLLLEYCNENGNDFIDIATPLLDGNGCLNDDYSSDGYCHINTSGYKIWTVTLRKYAEQKMAGTYANPSFMQQLSTN